MEIIAPGPRDTLNVVVSCRSVKAVHETSQNFECDESSVDNDRAVSWSNRVGDANLSGGGPCATPSN